VDYRLIQTQTGRTWLSPTLPRVSGLDAEYQKQFDAVFRALSKGERLCSVALTAQGRTVSVPVAVVAPRSSVVVARMTFEELCARPLGAADYLVIADHFPQLFIDKVPLLTMEQRNEVCERGVGDVMCCAVLLLLLLVCAVLCCVVLCGGVLCCVVLCCVVLCCVVLCCAVLCCVVLRCCVVCCVVLCCVLFGVTVWSDCVEDCEE
jgi:hypothetical protein